MDSSYKVHRHSILLSFTLQYKIYILQTYQREFYYLSNKRKSFRCFSRRLHRLNSIYLCKRMFMKLFRVYEMFGQISLTRYLIAFVVRGKYKARKLQSLKLLKDFYCLSNKTYINSASLMITEFNLNL